ncbi:MAG: nitroreductase family protein [Bacteroidota bacterium]
MTGYAPSVATTMMVAKRHYSLAMTLDEDDKSFVKLIIMTSVNPTLYREIIGLRQSTYPHNFIEGKKIPDAIISDILDAAVWAPTHGLTQPWFFKVFHGKGVQTFFKGMIGVYQNITPPEALSEKKIAKYKIKSWQVSHVLAVCMRHGDTNIIPEIEEIVATGCVIENIYLALAQYGIAGYLSTGDICYSSEMKAFLGLSAKDQCLGFFQLGYARKDAPERVRKRIPAQEKTEWVSE